MVLPIWQATIVDESGNVQDGSEITVQREVPGLPTAVLYSDREGNTLANNPVVTDADGYGYFYAAPGLYRITVTKGGFSRTWVDVSLEVLGSAPETNQRIAEGYNSQVDQIDPAERVAGTETGVRRFAPADVASMAAQHGGLPKMRVVAVSNVDISAELEDGDTLDGVTLAGGDGVLLTGQTAPEENGPYVVVAAAAGTASRHPAFSSFDEIAGTYFAVMEGTGYADTLWRCTSDRGGTIDTDPLVISEYRKPLALLTQNGGQTVAASSNVILSWDTELVDDEDWHSNSVNPTRVTVNAAGIYLVGAHYRINSSDNGDCGIFIRVNGTDVARDNIGSSAGVSAQRGRGLTTVVPLQAGDFVEAVARQSGAANPQTVPVETRMFVVRL